jgi:hypothetical protein
MKVAIMQPYIFPYIGYFQLMRAVDRFIFLDDVSYINKGWINRNRILVNNKDHLFTVPLKDASQNRLINSIEILPDPKWRGKFLRTLEMAYKKAPHFSEVFPLIGQIVQNEEQLIGRYIFNSFRVLNSYLGITTELLESSAIAVDDALKGQDRILALCQSQGATRYVNAIGGMELYSRDVFREKGIEFFFLKTPPLTYTQFGGEFIPWLSMLDLLMFNDREQLGKFLDSYELV